jgi:hypothetical protein
VALNDADRSSWRKSIVGSSTIRRSPVSSADVAGSPEAGPVSPLRSPRRMRNPRSGSTSVTEGAFVHIGIDVPSSFPELGMSWFDGYRRSPAGRGLY